MQHNQITYTQMHIHALSICKSLSCEHPVILSVSLVHIFGFFLFFFINDFILAPLIIYILLYFHLCTVTAAQQSVKLVPTLSPP